MAKLDHICVSIETLSTQPDAAIVTLAAVKFSLTHVGVESFVVNINPISSKNAGLRISRDTLDWWRTQRPDDINMWQQSSTNLNEALENFTNFCGNTSDINFWSIRSRFDFPILESSFRATDMKNIFWNIRDLGTAYYLAGLNSVPENRHEKDRDPINDCLNSILWLRKALGQII